MRIRLGHLLRLVPIAWSSTVTVACRPAIDVHVVASPAPEFAHDETFSFAAAGQAPSAYQSSERSAEVQRRVRLLVARFLEDRGYVQKPEGEGDFAVRVSSGRREREVAVSMALPRPKPEGPAWFEEHEVEDFVEGILIIDMLDEKKRQTLWHGAARVEINPEKIDDGILKRATAKIMASFPWTPAEPAATKRPSSP